MMALPLTCVGGIVSLDLCPLVQDIYCLDADGALFDAALLSAVAAFSHCKFATPLPFFFQWVWCNPVFFSLYKSFLFMCHQHPCCLFNWKSN